MSDLDARIDAVLDRLDGDIDRVTEKLGPLLQSESIDELSEAEADDTRMAVPYALGAYALSSMLFAYLRSEGKDTAIVMPELARVKERLERLSTPVRAGSEPPQDQKGRDHSARDDKARAPKRTGATKASGKHTRFEEDRVSKRKRKGARG